MERICCASLPALATPSIADRLCLVAYSEGVSTLRCATMTLLPMRCGGEQAKFLPEQSPYELDLPAPGKPPPELSEDQER